MSRRRRISLFALLGVVLLAGAVAGIWYVRSLRPAELLLGRWRFDGGTDEAEFFRDGRLVLSGDTTVAGPFNIETKHEQFEGRYGVVGDELRIRATIFFGMRLEEDLRFEISGDELRLYPPNGPVRVARRVK